MKIEVSQAVGVIDGGWCGTGSTKCRSLMTRRGAAGGDWQGTTSVGERALTILFPATLLRVSI